MGLVQKLTLTIVTLTLSIILAISVFAYSITSKALHKNVYQQITGTLELVTGIIDEYNEKMLSISSLKAQNREVKRALDKGINRGIAQSLNDTIRTHSFVNYMFVIDNEGYVFSTSTITHQGEKYNGEKWLYSKIENYPMFNGLFTNVSNISKPNSDPFLSDLKTSQWITSL
ncbi:cache domain-containing protein [Vibrio sonorensis]|uniref:cache domain-containing protein n=1 Tax=Vibrio sonorensis TaxID=1004316 RepID=UPI001114138D|nr:cache domain-containing protein [Vibrio sonorensis]